MDFGASVKKYFKEYFGETKNVFKEIKKLAKWQLVFLLPSHYWAFVVNDDYLQGSLLVSNPLSR